MKRGHSAIFIAIKLVAMVAICIVGNPAKADTWRGTAPFCAGKCLPGENIIRESTSGDGATCWTGTKVLCSNSTPSCLAAQTNTACYGVVLICDNGHYVGGNAPDWVSCSKFACGACFGFGKW